MKKIAVFFFIFSISGIYAQIVTIPDSNFKNALLGHDPVIDTNSDGEIQVSEAEAVTHLQVFSKNINSLVGIESFVNLVILNCSFNNLTELDITALNQLEDFRCDANELTSLDVSQNDSLTSLNCESNMLSVVNVTHNENLESLFCGFNPITSLDISQNPNLFGLWCSNTGITELDTSQNPNLLGAYIQENQLISLDFRQNPIINLVWCYNNNLEFLDVRSGSNSTMFAMLADGNPNLTCIAVDDVDYSNSQPCGFPSGWCKDDTAVYDATCGLSIDENTISKIVLYPNPVSETLYLGGDNPYETLFIYSIQGNLLMETKKTEIDVSTLTSGVYFVKAFGKGTSITTQFIKN
ncbi:T9SS type A sorting domain-containing protein [Aureisphaera galaxeae]|uniref:T9SS type A sorting domain-containing protein n=1 Tax=Aureisphaera galaxeae TaxID=1538023 RepID=UPI002350C8A8|nr:T9SS type A sorting domain-containing protein [Aureisphaera galaxeae]MDC8003966.1 T9SS type A sorting domain-containing protein [Aureisphaera galaxeae]